MDFLRAFLLIILISTILALCPISGGCNESEFDDNKIMNSKNVLGTPLKLCCTSPLTGFHRDGYCSTGPLDHGRHVVCAQMTDQFLQFSKSRGNDLTRAAP